MTSGGIRQFLTLAPGAFWVPQFFAVCPPIIVRIGSTKTFGPNLIKCESNENMYIILINLLKRFEV